MTRMKDDYDEMSDAYFYKVYQNDQDGDDQDVEGISGQDEVIKMVRIR